MTLWCVAAAPLLIGGDIMQMNDFTIDVLSNDEVLAVDQDPLGKAANCEREWTRMNAMWFMIITSVLLAFSAGGAEASETSARADYMKNHFGEMNFKPEGGFILRKGEALPNLVWDEPEIASALLKDTAIPTRWFDSDLNEVTKAEKTGRYYAYGEAPVPEGHPLCRAMTCCCLEKDEDLEALALKLCPGKADQVQEIVREWIETEEGVITLCGKLESEPPFEPERPGQWHMENATVHVRLKRKIRNIDSPPVKVSGEKTRREAGAGSFVMERSN